MIANPFDHVVNTSDVVLIGEVKDVSSSWIIDTRNIYTKVTIRVDQILKGRIQDDEIVVRTLGGTVGNVTQNVVYAPNFIKGARYGLFLREECIGASRFYRVMNRVYTLHPKNTTDNGSYSMERMTDEDFVSLFASMSGGGDKEGSESGNEFNKSGFFVNKPYLLKLF